MGEDNKRSEDIDENKEESKSVKMHKIISDSHFERISQINGMVAHKTGGKLIYLGDVDSSDVLSDLIELKKKFDDKESLEMLSSELEDRCIIVPGNHCHAYVHNVHIHSWLVEDHGGFKNIQKTFKKNNKFFSHLKTLVDSYLKCYKEKIPYTTINSKKIALCHGGIAKELTCGSPYFLWQRLISLMGLPDYELIKKNFEALKNDSYDGLLKGHSHNPFLIMEDSEDSFLIYGMSGLFHISSDKNTKKEIYMDFYEREFLISDDKRFILCPGAYMNGFSVTLYEQEKDLKVKFNKKN